MLDLKLLKGHQTANKEMTVGEPLCKFVNVLLCRGGAGVVKGTVLLENPQGSPVISLDQLKRQVLLIAVFLPWCEPSKQTVLSLSAGLKEVPSNRLWRRWNRQSFWSCTRCLELLDCSIQHFTLLTIEPKLLHLSLLNTCLIVVYFLFTILLLFVVS